MTMSLSEALQAIFVDEGGYSNNPRDSGGPTNMGITQQTLNAWCDANNEPRLDVRHLSREQAAEIYRIQYAKPIRFEELARLDGGLAYALLDFAVHSGVVRAVSTLQKLVGTTPDGNLGALTLAAVKANANLPELVAALMAARLAFLKRLAPWRHFGRGWHARLSRVASRIEARRLGNSAVRDYAEPINQPTAKGQGKFSLWGAILDSRRAQGGLIAALPAIVALLPEMAEQLNPALKLLEGYSWAPVVGNVITVLAAAYVVLTKKNKVA